MGGHVRVQVISTAEFDQADGIGRIHRATAGKWPLLQSELPLQPDGAMRIGMVGGVEIMGAYTIPGAHLRGYHGVYGRMITRLRYEIVSVAGTPPAMRWTQPGYGYFPGLTTAVGWHQFYQPPRGLKRYEEPVYPDPAGMEIRVELEWPGALPATDVYIELAHAALIGTRDHS
jgi:hypothetical protein